MFLFFASLQINDPDPVVWILIYGAMAVVCVMAAFKYYLRWLMIAQAFGYIIYCIILIPGVREWMASPDLWLLFDDLSTMKYSYIEESREFLGLIICLIVLTITWFRSAPGRKAG